MLEFGAVDLETDDEARSFVKDEEVDVVFAKSNGELISRKAPIAMMWGMR